MWSIFKRKSNEPSVDDLASNTDETLETLKKKSDYLEQNIANFQLQAKNAAKTDKKKALKFLKKKKASEAELEQIDKYILQLQDVQRTTEQSKLTAMVATSTKIAHRIIEKTLKET
ncbi:hypothetical protein MXB_2300 [Myxobolus squamalis]|nr:hypothetical protein MXB_2300 [Myxobolus squamalis]